MVAVWAFIDQQMFANSIVYNHFNRLKVFYFLKKVLL